MKILVVINSFSSGLSRPDLELSAYFEERAGRGGGAAGGAESAAEELASGSREGRLTEPSPPSDLAAEGTRRPPASLTAQSNVSAVIIGERPEKPFKRPLAARHAVFFEKSEGGANFFHHPEALALGLQAAWGIIKPRLTVSCANLRTRSFFPWAAADRQAAFVHDMTAVSWEEAENGKKLLKFEKPLFGGKRIGCLETDAPEVLALAAPRAFQGRPLFAANDSPPLIEIPVRNIPPPRLRLIPSPAAVEKSERGRETQDLTEASFIVTAGRGVGKAENFKLTEDLAQAIGASLGASRAVTDAGLQPHSRQIGQTGKTVAPDLYIACGVSGAAQHLAGMQNSRVIVAINKDPSAPIFKHCSYGIEGDLFVLLPKLTEALKRAFKAPDKKTAGES